MPSDSSTAFLQYFVPKRALTRFGGRVADARAGGITTWIIRTFIARYGVNMSEAVQPDPAAYATFNDFFTRALRPGARPLADTAWVCPVDGVISQCGDIDGDRIIQAKGHFYDATRLLGGDAQIARPYAGGRFATLYLSPRDYHRIHMPAPGRLTQMIHVPGELFSVNPVTARGLPGLFARNERLVCLFDGEAGPFALVLVGATIVGSMATVWHGKVNATRPGYIRHWHYPGGSPDDSVAAASEARSASPHDTVVAAPPVQLARGEEMGRFLLGSTVVLLVPRGALTFPSDWQAERAVRLGEAMSVAAA